MDMLIQTPAKCELFTALFQHIKFMTEHINIVFEKRRMYVQCMDNSHVAIMELTLPSEWFDRYDHQSAANITIGVNVGIFYRILSSREKTQQIHVMYSCENTDSLAFHLTSDSKSEFDKHFEMPLIDIDTECMHIPEIDHQAELTLSSSQFAGIINQLKMFGDTLDILCSEDKIMLASHSHNQGKMFVEIDIEDLASFAIEEGGQMNLSFSLGYLHNILQYHKVAKEVSLGFSDSMPMLVRYTLTQGSTQGSTQGLTEGPNDAAAVLAFYLAPKISED